MNIHLLESTDFSQSALARLKSVGELSFEDDAQALKKADVLFIRLKNVIGSQFLSSRCPNVKYILSPTTGHDHLDEVYLEKKNIRLISLRGEYEFLGSVPSTAEHTWALMLALIRKVPAAVSHVANGQWNRDLFRGNILQGKKLGILGMGRVGKQVNRFAQAFGMKVYTYDPYLNTFPEGVEVYRDYNDFARNVDIMSIHIPMNESNRNWLNSSRVGALKSGVFIINTSRAGVWDEAAVAEGVTSRRIGGVASDVLAQELHPELIRDSPLWRCVKQGENVIVTPHIAGACFETMQMTEEFVVDKFISILSGE